MAIKAQAFINFVVECTISKEDFDETDAGMEVR